jgi:WD40 repeat protein
MVGAHNPNNLILTVEYDPTGRYLAISDGVAGIFRIEDGREVAYLQFRTPGVATTPSAHYSLDGSQVVTAGPDTEVVIWDTGGHILHHLLGHNSVVYDAFFSPNGALVYSCGDETVRMWNAASGGLIRTYYGHQGEVVRLAVSTDGRRIGSVGIRDDLGIVWDVNSGQELRVLLGHRDQVWSIDFSPDGTSVVTASWDSTVRIWDLPPLAVKYANTDGDRGLYIYPNPAVNDLVLFVGTIPLNVSRVAISDVFGRVVFEGAWKGINIAIDCSSFPVGTYLVRSFLHGNQSSKVLRILR